MTIEDITPLQLAGLLGACLYMTNYMLLTVRILTPEHRSYFVLNIVAAALVLSSLTQAFNAATLAIQLFWIAVSTWGLITRFRQSRPRVVMTVT